MTVLSHAHLVSKTYPRGKLSHEVKHMGRSQSLHFTRPQAASEMEERMGSKWK